MNKKKLLEMIAKKEERKAELGKKANTTEDVKELRSINVELETINGEIAELREIVNAMSDEDPAPAGGSAEQPDARSQQQQIIQPNPLEARQIIGSFAQPAAGQPPVQVRSQDFEKMERGELFGTPEYRSAYLKSLQGKQLSEVEQRALTTAVGSGGAAVPTTTYNLIIEKLRQTSVLFPMISDTYIPGNVVLPVANARTAAVWSDEAVEGTIGDDTIAGVSLAGYTLAKYAKISAAALAMTVDAFEAYIVDQIGQQLAIAVENAILNGLGPTPGGGNKPQPTGILNGVTWDATNSKEYATTISYDDLVDLRALLKTPYRPLACFCMNSNMEAQLFKIKDTQARPIFTQAPQNGFEPRILNMPYRVDDYMPDDTILLCVPKYYYMNFSQNPVIESSKEAGFTSASTIYRGILIADGKPALSEAFVKLSKTIA